MRVTFVLAVRTPYRDDFLHALSASAEVDVSVIYTTESEHWRDWTLDAPRYGVQYLRTLSIGGRRGGYGLKLNWGVRHALRRARPDVLWIGGYSQPADLAAMRWAVRNSVPYLLGSETTDLRPRRLRSSLVRPLVRSVVRHSGAMIATSTPAVDYLVRLGAPRENVFILPNAPDVRRLASEADAARASRVPHAATGTAPTGLFVGRLIEVKSVEMLLTAWAEVQAEFPLAQLLVAGSGPLRERLEAKARSEQLNVEFLGFREPADLVGLYSQADVFVLPSTFEPYGVVLLEAMACGVPVVASSAVGAAPDLVSSDCGIVFPSGDARALADALMVLLKDDRRREEMGRSAVKSALRWDMTYCIGTFKQAASVARGEQGR